MIKSLYKEFQLDHHGKFNMCTVRKPLNKTFKKIDSFNVEKILEWKGHDVYTPVFSTFLPPPIGRVLFLVKGETVRPATLEEWDEIMLLVAEKEK